MLNIIILIDLIASEAWTGICSLDDQYNEYTTTAPVLQLNLLDITQSFQMMAFPNPVLLLLLMLCVWGKCIFDEVQGSIRVLSPPGNQPNPSDKVKHEVSANEQEDWLPHVRTLNHHNAISQDSPNQRSKRKAFRKRIKASDKPQPIRIKTWSPRESPVLSQWETERLGAAVSDAINTVSRLLAGIVSVSLCLDLNTKNPLLHLYLKCNQSAGQITCLRFAFINLALQLQH